MDTATVETATPGSGQTAVDTTPATVPADLAAADKGNFADFKKARTAERIGKPLAEVPTKATTPTVKEPPTPKTKPADTAADERMRRAVAEAVALKDREIAELRAKVPQTKPESAPTQKPSDRFLSMEEWAAKNEGKTINDYLDARDEWRDARQARAAAEKSAFDSHAKTLTERGAQFDSRMTKALESEPDLGTKIPPAMLTGGIDTLPFSALSPEQARGAKFTNLVAEIAFRSEHPAEFLKHLHAHPEDAKRAAEQASKEDALLVLAAIDGRIGASRSDAAAGPQQTAADESVAEPSPITSAPPPPSTVKTRTATSTDPKMAAFQRGDWREYSRISQQERLSALRPA